MLMPVIVLVVVGLARRGGQAPAAQARKFGLDRLQLPLPLLIAAQQVLDRPLQELQALAIRLRQGRPRGPVSSSAARPPRTYPLILWAQKRRPAKGACPARRRR
jgi:hypothetical protein